MIDADCRRLGAGACGFLVRRNGLKPLEAADPV
jgi:hypothetical protein